MKIIINTLAAIMSLLLLSGKAHAYSHEYVNDMRSSYTNHVFVAQSIEGEYGPGYSLLANNGDTGKPTHDKTMWQGYGFNTSLGLEVLKFIQFSAGHTFVNLRDTKSGLNKM